MKGKSQMEQMIVRTDITNEAQLKRELVKTSKVNPSKWITFFVTFGKTRIFILDRKPQTINVSGAEDTFRAFGGFFKNGQIIEPSNTFKRQYNFCPVLG